MAHDTEAQQQSGSIETAADIKTKADLVKAWLSAIELSSNEEKDWRENADEAWDIYEASKDALLGTAFNIYHANIETLCPSLYNSTPVPDVRRRYGDRDPDAKTAADVIERILTYSMDDYDYDAVMIDTVADLAVTGRGVSRVMYEAEEVDVEQGGVGAQTVSCKQVAWSSFRRGPGRSWEDVEWVAFAHYMSRDELKRLSPKYGSKVSLDCTMDSQGEAQQDGAQHDNPEGEVFKRAMVWELWDKDKRTVRFIAPGFREDQIAEVPDPLGLKDFYPIPRPMMSGKRAGRLVPLAPYRIYRPIIAEIDTLSKRITRLIRQLRPRALGPGSVDLKALADADDGEIVEVANVAAYLDSGGMDKMLAWFPMEPVVKAVEMLYIQREQAKQSLFEVSGLADIMRGQSNPNETLGAQEMKGRWGSLRIQKSQAEVQRYARDLIRLKAEIIAEKFSPENLAMMSGVQMEEPALMVITDQKMRDYRIDIETDSTIQGDKTRNQEAMASFVEGSGAYFAAIAPIVESGGMSKVAAVTIYSAFARNFKLGKEVDAVLDQLADDAQREEQEAQGQPPPPSPEEQKLQAEMQMGQQKMEMEGQKLQMDQQAKQADLQTKQQMAQQDAQTAQAKAQNEMAIKQQEFELKKQLALMEAELKRLIAVEEMQLKATCATEDMKIKERSAENDRKLKAQGKDGGTKVHNGPGIDGDEVGNAIKALGEMITKSQQQIAQLMASGNTQVIKAITAPKKVTTPDGRTYTSASMQ